MECALTATDRDSWRRKEIFRVTLVGFWVNLILSVCKIGAGFLGNSRAVVADGIHSLSDLVTDVAVLVGVHYWMAPPDSDHPYGHKRLESMISLSIGVLLGLAGAGIAYDAISRIGVEDGKQVGSYLALGVTLGSVVSKEILYRWTVAKAAVLKSDAVKANAWDHRSDALSSIPTALAVGVSLWFPAWNVVDLIGALLVAGFIFHAAWGICKEAVHVLLDGSDVEAENRITEFVRKTEGVKDVHAVRIRFVGQALQVDLHALVDPSLTIREAHDIATRVENSLYTDAATEYIKAEVSDVLVHVEPWEPEGHSDPHP